jgi:hypothetical protein
MFIVCTINPAPPAANYYWEIPECTKGAVPKELVSAMILGDNSQ